MVTIWRNSYVTWRHQLILRILKEAFWTYCLLSKFRCHRFNIHGVKKGGRNPAAPPYPLVPEDGKKPGLNRVKPLDNYFIYCYGYTDATAWSLTIPAVRLPGCQAQATKWFCHPKPSRVPFRVFVSPWLLQKFCSMSSSASFLDQWFTLCLQVPCPLPLAHRGARFPLWRFGVFRVVWPWELVLTVRFRC